MVIKIPLMEDSFSKDEITAVMDCMKSGEYTQGRLVDEFEKKFAEWNGSRHAVMVNSGSSANLLVVYLLKLKYGLKDGDEILVPAVTWPTTIYPIIQNNLVPVFCDVDKSFNIDIDSMKRMFTEKTKAVFVVHLLGQPANINAITEFCTENDIIVIEDCCESTGAKVAGTKVGNFGVMGTFSFYFAHHMTTIEGGMIVTDDADTADYLKSARSHGWVRGSNRENNYSQFKDTKFLFDILGYNIRSTNLNAAIGLVQLKRLDCFIKTRIANHRSFLEGLTSIDIGNQKTDIEETSSFCFAFLCKSEEERDYVSHELNKRGVETRPVVAGNLLRQPVFKWVDLKADDTPMADRIHETGFYVANNQSLDKNNIKYILDSLKEILTEFRRP